MIGGTSVECENTRTSRTGEDAAPRLRHDGTVAAQLLCCDHVASRRLGRKTNKKAETLMSEYAQDRAAFLTARAKEAAELEAERARREAMLLEWGIESDVPKKKKKKATALEKAAAMAAADAAAADARGWAAKKKKAAPKKAPAPPKPVKVVQRSAPARAADGKKLTAAQRMAMLSGGASKPSGRRTSATVLAAAAASAGRRASQS